MFERGAAVGLNHLLAQQPWAAERLKAFAGQCAEFRCPPFPDLRFAILESGLVREAAEDAASALVVKLTPSTLPLVLARDEAALKKIEIEGSAELANTVQHLFRHLAWDIEEDLSRLFPDVIAHRLAEGGRAFAAWQSEAATRLAENLAEYLTEEQPLLARPADVASFLREVDRLGEDAGRLEKRIENLEKARGRGRAGS
jgi:ubiquinone biosynthesis protein UbiJ